MNPKRLEGRNFGSKLLTFLPHLVKAIEIVQVPVLPAAVMYRILGHGLLRPTKHRRLVHVVPHKQRWSGSL